MMENTKANGKANGIVNLTQHPSTPEQQADGVVDLGAEVKNEIRGLLTFNSIPTKEEMEDRARKLAQIVKNHGYEAAMIGGAPYFMSTLERVLTDEGIKYYYAFSQRVVVEETQPDGTVVKKATFKYEGLF